MGGSAFLIHGEFDPDVAAASASPPSFLDRLRGRKPPSASVTEFPNGRSLVQFPADRIARPLAQDYLEFVRGGLPSPVAASKVVLEYLKTGQPTIYLRAERERGETTGPWFVQLSFSGAAGMCETSARVAAHWASLWYVARGEPVRATILLPAGFSATRTEPLADGGFIATPEHGYAEREDGALTIDASFIESEAEPERLLKELEERYGPQLADGSCGCELCQRSG